MSDEAVRPSSDSATAQTRSGLIAVRRALVLILMTLVVPGSAQLAAGNRKVGRIAFRTWLAALAVLLLIGLLALVMREEILGLLTNWMLVIIDVARWLLLALGIGWSLLVLDAWRLANPPAMPRVGAAISAVIAFSLVIAGTAVGWTATNVLGSTVSAIEGMLGQGGSDTQVQNGRYNILLLGGDSGSGREGLRPDSITVASVDAATGRTVLLSLPRNLQRVPFPTSSPLHSLYPDGYYCPKAKPGDECMLNGVYTLAMQKKSLFPGVKNPGVETTQAVVEEILGLKINYWVLIDIKGMQSLIDALGGVRIDVNERVPMGSSHSSAGIFDYIEPGKGKLLDGFHAVWFARSREGAGGSDYKRMIRQKCVMTAMLKQMDPVTVITKFQAIAGATTKVAGTSLPTAQLGTMSKLAMKAKSLPTASVSFTPPLLQARTRGASATADPDFAQIRKLTAEVITASEALDAAKPVAAPSSATSTATKTATAKSTASVNSTKTDDLDAVCKAS
jgi:polyisoprenyl-teichoic acid--peptidoglycan teichoic acid transferase